MNENTITAINENHEAQGEDEGNNPAPGIIKELGELGPGAVITEAALAKLFNRHPVSIKRAVERGELPPPTRLLGGPVWTVGTITRHIETRLEEASKDAERHARKIRELRP